MFPFIMCNQFTIISFMILFLWLIFCKITCPNVGWKRSSRHRSFQKPLRFRVQAISSRAAISIPSACFSLRALRIRAILSWAVSPAYSNG